MEDNYHRDDMDKIWTKHMWISIFQSCLAATSTIGIFAISRYLPFENFFAWTLSGIWIFVLIGIHAYFRSKDECRYLFFRERYENLRLIKGNQ